MNMSSGRSAALLAWLRLARFYQKMQRCEQAHLRHYELTLAQFDVLAQLSVAAGISQQELASRLLVTKGNICGLIDRLAERSLVVRCIDLSDRRAHRLYLTEAGHSLAARVVPEHDALIRQQMGVLSSGEQRALLQLLRRLDRSLRSE
jgi:DNA-binding MarR family transcriptional regulator